MPMLCSHILSRSVWPHKHVSFSAKHRSLVHEVIFFFLLVYPNSCSLAFPLSCWVPPVNERWKTALLRIYSTVPRRQRVVFIVYDLDFVHPVETHLDVVKVQKRNTDLLSSALTSSSGVQALPGFATNLPLLPPTRSFYSLLRRFSLLNPQCIFFFFISATMAAVALEISSSSSFASGIFSAMGTGHGSVQQLGWCGVRHSPCMSLSPWG